jgi:hypothetical protein
MSASPDTRIRARIPLATCLLVAVVVVFATTPRTAGAALFDVSWTMHGTSSVKVGQLVGSYNVAVPPGAIRFAAAPVSARKTDARTPSAPTTVKEPPTRGLLRLLPSPLVLPLRQVE